jgi:SPRY domain/Concanavalin A-like lectin/glucanases superfamily
MPLILGANSASGGYTVKNSLRFNSGSSDYLNRTPSSATNQKTWTWSAWVKIAYDPSNYDRLFSAGTTTANHFEITLMASADGSELRLLGDTASSRTLNWTTAMKFRDPSAWYHIVVAMDTTQATQANRAKVYINGSLFSTAGASSTLPSLNDTYVVNSTTEHNIGRSNPYGNYYNGYMSEINFIDGQQLTPSSFGQTDPSTPSSGIWIPKAYTGSYGTNGFYLKFANSASLGTDSSGLGNNFTSNGGIASTSQSTDTPTNNFATWNSINYNGGTLSQGNLAFNSTVDWYNILATIGVSTGKWYWESKITANSGNNHILYGIANINYSVYSSGPIGTDSASNSVGYSSFGNGIYIGNVSTAYGSTYTTGDIIGTALDMTNGTLTFYKNGSSLGTATTGLSGTYCPAVSLGTNSEGISTNFGSPSYSSNGYTDGAGYGNFSYAVPSGYYALCSANLAKYG